jgi:nucleoside-diphosphate-sugar epimerase
MESFRRVNLGGTINVARAALKNGANRIVYISTTAVHGFNLSRPATEDDYKNPVFNYSVSKLEAENWLFDFGKQNDLEVTAVRPGNVFGPADHTFIRKYMDALASGKMAYVKGGRSFTCPTYAGNLANGVYLAALSKNAPGEAFIITDGLSITWKQFTQAVAEKMGVCDPRLSIPFRAGLALATVFENLYKLMGSDHPPLVTKYRVYNAGSNYHFSIEKAKSILGFEPETSIEEAVAKTVSWYQQEHNRR